MDNTFTRRNTATIFHGFSRYRPSQEEIDNFYNSQKVGLVLTRFDCLFHKVELDRQQPAALATEKKKKKKKPKP